MAETEARTGSTARQLVPGTAAAVAAGGIFVVLTAATGTTYHLFPVLIGFLPGGLPRVLGDRSISPRLGAIAAGIGLTAAAAAWGGLEVLDEMPSATLIEGQPGGVAGEFLLGGAIGAAIGGWWGSRGA